MKNLATFLAFTALVAYSEARGTVDDDYISYVSKFGKQPTSTREQIRRQANFRNAQATIDDINRNVQATGRGATAAHNSFSDLDQSEKDRILGRKSSGTVNSLPMYDGLNNSLGHHQNIDHTADGRMHPVKDQGSCGSCWAFGAMTSLEGALAVKDNTTNPKRLSEQEGVDCSNYNTTTKFGKNYGNYGCGGGLEYNHWDFAKDHGIMYDEDYPYTARDDSCSRDLVDDRATMTRVQGWQRESRSVAAIAERLHDTPIAIGVYASCSAFMYYESGIITQEQCPQSNSMDHSIVIVAYNADGSDDGDDGDDSDDGDDGDDGDNSNLNCTQTKWWYTCEPVQSTRSSDHGYWTAQNSWGTGWGENGYVRLELAEGGGVACSNCDATSPNVSSA